MSAAADEKLRRYCWRIGDVVETSEEEKCPECGSLGHIPLEDQNACGRYVECSPGLHGHGCEMRALHAGGCGYFDDGKCEEASDA